MGLAVRRSPELPPLVLRGAVFDPPLFCAPMASITHSAFRRLLADFGGYGALFTEMLSAKMIPRESIEHSPCLKRRPQEGKVVYQLLVIDTACLPDTLERLSGLKPDGLDLNVACSAPNVLKMGGGARLFEDPQRLRAVLKVLRDGYAGPLTAKLRLGSEDEGWRRTLRERLSLLEGEGVDALTVHPRFFEEEFRRSARHGLYEELAALTRLPIIASGDISGAEYFRANAAELAPAAGLMIGRMAAACPWVFARWRDPGLPVDRAEVWRRLCRYISEDFEPHLGLIRLKILAPYYARNFKFGHTFFRGINSAPDWDTALTRGEAFLTAGPELMDSVSVSGI